MKCHVLNSQHSIKLAMVGHICKRNILEMEVEKSEIQGHLWLIIELKASLDYVRLYHKEAIYIQIVKLMST